MTSELLTIQILSAKSILNVNNNGTNRTDHEIRTHHNAQSGESRTLCSKHNIYIFSKKVAKIITKLREGDGLLMHFCCLRCG